MSWSPDGDKYVVVVNDKVDIYELETASVSGTIVNPKKISTLKFLNVSSGCKTCTYDETRLRSAVTYEAAERRNGT